MMCKDLQLSGTESVWLIDDYEGTFEIEFWKGNKVIRYPIEYLLPIVKFLQANVERVPVPELDNE